MSSDTRLIQILEEIEGEMADDISPRAKRINRLVADALTLLRMDTDIQQREPVSWFADRMEERLRANDHKGGWDTCPDDWLLMRIREEANELEASFEPHVPFRFTIMEAADVANFAMMIADRARRAAGINA